MKKIIAAFDGLNYSTNTRDYAVELSRMSGAHLTGVFLDDVTYTSYKIYDLIVKDGVSEKKLRKYKDTDTQKRTQSSIDFENYCRKVGINFNTHHDHDVALSELVHETIFADLLIIDSKETLTHYDEKVPSRFIKNLLADTNCPVFLVQSEYHSINKLVFFYDGSPASVYALKMFSCMFTVFENAEVELITVKAIDDNLHLPDNKLVKEFMHIHFRKTEYKVLKGLPETEIRECLKGQSSDTLIVLGAYGRSAVSRWFRASLADYLLKETQLPVFISHH
jgi:nucleotide-binding universal stress UspA family protein